MTTHQSGDGDDPIRKPDQSPDPRQNSLPIYLILAVLSIPVILLSQPPVSTIIGCVLLVSAVIVVGDRNGWQLSALQNTLPKVTINTRLLYALEMLLIVVVLLVVTQSLQNWSVNQRVRGGEFSYLINSGVIAANVYHKTGVIPLWDPLIGRGEPLVENPFSFVLNPFMTLPIFWFGAIQGTKIAVLLHICLMGLGGWVLGWVLGLKTPARLLLGLLLGASGSMAGAIGMGFYQMSLSQAYVPWVYAGLLGMIYRPGQRRMVALLVIAATLLIFAGTFWYALPTALGCGLVVAFYAIRRSATGRRWTVDRALLLRVIFAGMLLVGIAAVRLLPQAINHDYIDHELEFLTWGPIDYLDILRLYVTPSLFGPFNVESLYYHYIIPLGLVIFLMAGRLVIALLRIKVQARWRVVIPGFMLIIFFSAWAQGGTPFMLWLYSTFGFLREWRFVGRMQAAATPWIAIIAAIWFENIVTGLWESARRREFAFVIRAAAGVILLTTLIIGVVAVNDVLQNWNNWSGTEPNDFVERPPLEYLRSKDPNSFITVQTSSFYGYLPFYETDIRASFGNPDYRAVGIAPTLGTTEIMKFPPAYAISGGGDIDPAYLSQTGFHVLPDSDHLFGWDLLWTNPTALSYMFLVHVGELQIARTPLTQDVTQPVTTFVNNVDEVEATVSDYSLGQVLVVQQVAYPGWQVSIDGQPAALESVGGLIGVRLPPQTGDATNVVFSYRPTWLFVGVGISLISFVGFILYLLHLDRLFRRKRSSRAITQGEMAEMRAPR